MKTISYTLFTLVTLHLVRSQSPSPTCSNNYVGNTSFNSCVDLPFLNSFLHWTYNPSAATLDIAYHHTSLSPSTSKWVAWAVNPVNKGMIGSQCLVAYHDPKHGSMVAYTSPISSYSTSLSKADLSFKVSNLSALGLNGEIIIYATLEVPKNATTLNHVWQDGPLSSDGTPQIHSTTGPNVRSMASLNLLSGAATTMTTASGPSLRNIHGVLNAVSWGILMPTGAIIARYMRVFPGADPAWFYLHVGCQMSAYAIGVAGWATGLRLGSQSKGVEHSLHRKIGITLFCLATLQVFALLIRPTKDHKYRAYWNIYHHSIGYTTIILSIINVMAGFHILEPNVIWKKAYVGVIVALCLIAVFLEVFTWYMLGGHKIEEATDSESKKDFA
ncbi:hypothetical protein RND81_10G001500 [Saponaria officinalis]|uniref:Cytochrome b561 and DOMON domain-containing protein n=1 Tax=Saponaria officinalis TaxID=3572 RepID=A0AAW1HYR1_SAPOF